METNNKKITAPYNFVPLNEKVFIPDWSENVSHDLPFSDSEDGTIEVTVHNVSPVFTRDGEKANEEKPSPYSSHIVGKDGKRHYFIPSTTIKGMLREIVQIMSFGKMQEGNDYQNRYFGWRDVAGKSDKKEKKKEYRDVTEKGKPGWLKKQNGSYMFVYCIGEIKKIDAGEVKERFSAYAPSSSIWKTNMSVENDGNSPTYPQIDYNEKSYRLVCTGAMKEKTHELLFPLETGESELLDKETISAFKTIYADTPDFAEKKEGKECFLKALDAGNEIPVFRYERNGKVYLGLSKMFKIPYKYNVKEQVEFIQKPDLSKHDLADIIFGYAGKEKSLKGRVAVSHAFMEGTVADKTLTEITGILGQPKASYYPLYIKQTESPYKTYDDNAGIAGRKLYRIHQGNTTTDLPQNENNGNTKFKPIPEGQTFRLRIALHNMKPMETGAILAALTLNGTEGVFLNLGLAKSFGFGKCRISMDDVKLDGLSHEMQYYMHEFEKQMSMFTYASMKEYWADSECVKKLVNILSEHNDDTVKMMELDDYRKSKDENPFNTLPEGEKPIHSWLSDEDKDKVKKQRLAPKYAEAEDNIVKAQQYEADGEYDDALRSLRKAINVYVDEIVGELKKNSFSTDPERKRIDEINQMISEVEAEKQAATEAAKAKSLQEKKEAGLAAELDKLTGNGAGYSVREFKVCFQRVDKWLKQTNSQELSADDKAAFVNTVKRLLQSPVKKDIKDTRTFDRGSVWPKLKIYLGDEVAKQLFDENVE